MLADSATWADAVAPQVIARAAADDGSVALRAGLVPAPPGLRSALAPTAGCLLEWRDHYVSWPGATGLRVGDEWFAPVSGDVFRVRFENRVGLASVQAYAGARPLGAPVVVEVLSSKFPTPAAHVDFLRALLDDLFARATRLPFALGGPTARHVAPVPRPPAPLFVLHFLCEAERALDRALAVVLAVPHRALVEHEIRVPMGEVSEVDADVLHAVLHAPEEWVETEDGPLGAHGARYTPAHVWQRRPRETFDTPENRFVLGFLRRLLDAAAALASSPLWRFVPAPRRALVERVRGSLRRAAAHPAFAEVGALHQIPHRSQVLARRDGYRELRELYERFLSARRPVFARLDEAIPLRDIATLYEVWAFLALAEECGAALEAPVEIDLPPFDESDPQRGGEARIGQRGRLVYNRSMTKHSYSLPLRPDFTWMWDGRPEVVLDAKLRLERTSLETEDEDERPATVAKRADLYKMHTYRDALGVRAAVAVYPGDETVFYARKGGRRPVSFGLAELLDGELEGIGALALKPHGA